MPENAVCAREKQSLQLGPCVMPAKDYNSYFLVNILVNSYIFSVLSNVFVSGK